MVPSSLKLVLYLIFSWRNDRHLGNVDKKDGVLPVKSKVSFLPGLLPRRQADLHFICSASLLEVQLRSTASSAWIQPCPREGLLSFVTIWCPFSWQANIFILFYQDQQKKLYCNIFFSLSRSLKKGAKIRKYRCIFVWARTERIR